MWGLGLGTQKVVNGNPATLSCICSCRSCWSCWCCNMKCTPWVWASISHANTYWGILGVGPHWVVWQGGLLGGYNDGLLSWAKPCQDIKRKRFLKPRCIEIHTHIHITLSMYINKISVQVKALHDTQLGLQVVYIKCQAEAGRALLLCREIHHRICASGHGHEVTGEREQHPMQLLLHRSAGITQLLSSS